MRTQHPKAFLDSRTRRNWAGVYYDENGTRRYVTLGPKTELKKAEAQNKLDQIVGAINVIRVARDATASTTLAQYVEGVYLAHGRRKWKASTAGTTEQRLRSHIIGGELAAFRLSELNRLNMQAFLDARGDGSFSVVNHLRWDLVAILDLAMSDGLVPRNQARQLHTPTTVRLPNQPVMTPEQVKQALGVLDLRERLFCRLAIFAGMRPGEIIALRWTDIDTGMARVDDRYYKGQQGTTKNRKARMVALSESVQRDLGHWRPFAIRADGFVFESEAGTPIKYENLWQRYIRPRFAKIGLAWADFRAMRRTNSTLMRAAGADAKVSADNRGHGLGVAMEEYTHSTPDQKREAVRKLEAIVN